MLLIKPSFFQGGPAKSFNPPECTNTISLRFSAVEKRNLFASFAYFAANDFYLCIVQLLA
jgi:hypothetical protein